MIFVRDIYHINVMIMINRTQKIFLVIFSKQVFTIRKFPSKFLRCCWFYQPKNPRLRKKPILQKEFRDIPYSSMIATRAVETTRTLGCEQKPKSLLALKRLLEQCQCFWTQLAGEKGKPAHDVRRLLRDMLVRQKRVNLAEGTSIIGQRLTGRGELFTVRETARRGFQQARVLNRPLRWAVFADVVRLQRRSGIDAIVAAAAIQSRFFTPMRRNNCKLGSSLGREINRDLLQNEHPDEKREERRDLIFQLVHRVAARVEFEYGPRALDFQNEFDKAYL